MVIRGWLACVGVGAAGLVGCVDAAPFHCQTAQQCVAAEGQGTCEPTGYCSFADESCDSGRRYGDHAGENLARACVGGGVFGNDASDGMPMNTGCTGGEDNVAAAGRCYMYFATARSWVDAHAFCLAMEPSANVVASTSVAENDIIVTMVPVEAWMGATDLAVEGAWLWSTGETVTWTNWRAGEPNNAGDEDCALIEGDTGGVWDDRGCSTLLPYICERGL